MNEFTNSIINHIFGNFTDARVIIVWWIVTFLSNLLARTNAPIFPDIGNKVRATIQKKERYKHLIAILLNWGETHLENSRY